MRKLSLSRQREERAMKPLHNTFRIEFPRCWICNQEANDGIHEITSGGGRRRGRQHRAAWVRTCRLCHDGLQDHRRWPIARQLALKALRDPAHYDRVVVNQIRGRDDDAINEVDVWKELPAVLAQVRVTRYGGSL